jgi:MFS family permease
VAVGDRLDQFRALARQSVQDVLDQRDPFGRLALVQMLMLAGDTLVTISLAGSLFISVSPHEAKSKVFLYLVITLAPFSIVSPFLGPLIDRSRGARRAMVVLSALGRAVLCPFMAMDVHSLLLFPEAFLILVLSKLYLVTRGALVPEMAATSSRWATPSDSSAPETDAPASEGDDAAPAKPLRPEYAALNARLTLLGTIAGFVASVPGIILLKTAGSPGVLIFDSIVFVVAAVAGARLPIPGARRVRRRGGASERLRRLTDQESLHERPLALGNSDPTIEEPVGWAVSDNPDLESLQPIAHPEVVFGLSAMSLIRGLAGFLVFLLAFGLRREGAGLEWYGLALGASGIGAIVGLTLVARLRKHLIEQQLILAALWLIGATALGAAFWSVLMAQVALSFMVGVAGSLAQPSFDAMTQRFVPVAAQGRTFAKFATRQQLVWVVGAIIPVVIALPFAV